MTNEKRNDCDTCETPILPEHVGALNIDVRGPNLLPHAVKFCRLACALEWFKEAIPAVLRAKANGALEKSGLKVFGWRGWRTEAKAARNGSNQTREIVAARSKAAAARAAGMTPRDMEPVQTANMEEMLVALAKPGTVFWRQLDDVGSFQPAADQAPDADQ